MAAFALKGSERQARVGATSVGKAHPDERLEVSVLLRRASAAAFKRQVKQSIGAGTTRTYLTREAFAAQFGADKADIAAVRKFAGKHKLSVVQAHPGRRTIVLSGTVENFNAAFGVDLQRFEHPGGSYRGRVGSIYLPETLKGVVEAVLGLDNRPAAKAHFRIRGKTGAAPRRAGAAKTYNPTQVAGFYNYPPGTGEGQCVGIIELGGGERPSDLATYFSGLGISPAPTVTVVSVDHASNSPSTASGADSEVMLDIEVVGSIAPQAKIAVYFAPNTSAGFLDAITTAIHDTTNKPSVISISWGGPESSYTQQSLTAFDSAFQAAATLGITICVAAGDNGSSDGVTGSDNVDFPASSPHALACGGTSLHASGTAITSETVWNDGAQGGATGGGVSTVFSAPTWQSGLDATLTAGGTEALKMRGVPDVSGDADPQTGYNIYVDGGSEVVGGTSAVAPLWAGLIARINAASTTPAGFINPTLYANPQALNDITHGNNGTFAAASGWDACTGLGSPNGAKIAALFPAAAAPTTPPPRHGKRRKKKAVLF